MSSAESVQLASGLSGGRAAPTLGLWGSGDNYLTEDRMIRSAEHVSGPWRYERIEGASHWLQLDRPDEVNALLVDFVT